MKLSFTKVLVKIYLVNKHYIKANGIVITT